MLMVANTVTGLTSINGGTYLASSVTQTFNGGLSGQRRYIHGIERRIGSAAELTLIYRDINSAVGAFNVSGNWAQSGGTFDPGTNTVYFTAGSGTQTINTGGVSNSSFYSINHSGAAGLQLVANGLSLTTGGTFMNSAGSLT